MSAHVLLYLLKEMDKIVKRLMALIWVCYLEKMDPSEIERTYNIRKQQTRFY